MPMRTTAVEAAAARGWSKKELARRTGLSLSTIYNLGRGAYPVIDGKTIDAIMAVFPDLPYERLFVSGDSNALERNRSQQEQEVAAA